MVKIILCMIVRNEAQIIERCFDTVATIIDAACVCDTGSDDGTPELAARAFEQRGISYQVMRHEWENFGTNRTRAFQDAKRLAGELGWDLSSAYALFVDADMLLCIGDEFDAACLTDDAYRVRQYAGTLEYDNLRLARLDHVWRSVGATHEYWAADTSATPTALSSLWIEDCGDGGSKAEKFERDIRLLEAELEALPGNPRTMFYLAQSYFDVGRFEEARSLYLQRSQAGGWEEEAWYASYRLGVCSLNLDCWQRAVSELLVAWDRRPTRAEPLYDLAKAARIRGLPNTALMLAERALALPLPEGDTLFIDRAAYRDGPIEEISITSFYAGDRARGLAALDVLLHSHTASAEAKNTAAWNATFYIAPLTTYAEAARVEVRFEFWGETHTPAVGSICRADEGYVMVNRMLNYYQERGMWFIPRDAHGQYVTRNLWLTLDLSMNPRSIHAIDDEIVDEVALIPAATAMVRGIEDARLVRWQGAWWFVGNSRVFEASQHARVVLARLNSDCNRIEHLVPLRFKLSHGYEKNWSPFIYNDRLLLLYSSDPTIILEPDPATGECTVVSSTSPLGNLGRYRGSSPLVPFGSRYLGIVHEVAFGSDQRVYLHRFIELDPATWTVTRVSHPLTFLHTGVEYCCGLSPSHEPGKLVLSFSFEDRESWVTEVECARVCALLLPIESLAHLDPVGSV